MPDLLTTFSFHVELDGVDIGAFKEASGIESKTEIVEYKEATKSGKMIIRKQPGAMSWSDITLKRRIDNSTELWDWRRDVENGNIDAARRNGSIVLYDSTNSEVARWNFESGWPSRWKGADLDAGADGIAVEEISITHEGLTRA